jgi:CheY-like chemotaxis protein/anti-sigma regulatory factor (Ser/Thr protein kinase)
MDLKPINILVVDDSISIVKSLVKILEISGFDADPAYNGHDALRKLSAKEYDIILCDIEMPGMGGLDLLNHVRREIGDDVSFILMTGYLEQDYFLNAIRLGASDFIRKPIDSQQILRSIQSQLDKRKDNWDYFTVSKFVDIADVKITLTPIMFRQVDFIKVFTKFFRQNLNLPNNILNELLLCMEEMLYNAFIHGTLNLQLHERTLSYESYQKLIAEKLRDREISNKSIKLRLIINQMDKNVTIEVEDQGDGFDHISWLSRIKATDHIQLEEYGRGISIIYNLCDEVSFDKGGRMIRIVKSLANVKFSKQASR